MDEIDGGDLRVADVAEHVVAVRLRPFVGRQQAGGGAVGEWRGVARGQRAEAGRLVERGLQRGEFLDRGVGTQHVVA